MSAKAKWSVSGAAILLVVAVLIYQFVLPSNEGSSIKSRFGVASAQAAEPIGHIGTGPGAEAVERASNADKYAFVLFYRQSNEQLATTAAVVESAQKKIGRKSDLIEINVMEATEQDIVNKFGVNRAPMPLVLVVAPNGAIMGGFPANQLTDDTKLVDAVGSKATEQTLKALQNKNMVALCVQSRKTSDNSEAMRGVEDFLKDAKYGTTTAVVKADPTDPVDAKFLSKLGVDLQSAKATTVLLAPPGTVVATFQGAAPKEKYVAAVQAAAAPKSGGCCPSGSGKSCGPTGAPVPQSKPMAIQPQVQAKPIPTSAASAPTTTKQGK